MFTTVLGLFNRFSLFVERGVSLVSRAVFGSLGTTGAVAEAAIGARAAATAAEAQVASVGNRLGLRFPGGIVRTALFGAAGLAAILFSTSAFASSVEGATTGAPWYQTLLTSGFLEAGILATTVFGTLGIGGVTGLLANIAREGPNTPVSYTHLTLPTILRV